MQAMFFFGCCWFSISVACCCHEPLGRWRNLQLPVQGQQLLPYPTWLPDAEGDRGHWDDGWGWWFGRGVFGWEGFSLYVFFVTRNGVVASFSSGSLRLQQKHALRETWTWSQWWDIISHLDLWCCDKMWEVLFLQKKDWYGNPLVSHGSSLKKCIDIFLI